MQLMSGGSTGAAWLTLISGRSAGKVTPVSQRRASITGGAKVAAIAGFKGWVILAPLLIVGGAAFRKRPPERSVAARIIVGAGIIRHA